MLDLEKFDVKVSANGAVKFSIPGHPVFDGEYTVEPLAHDDDEELLLVWDRPARPEDDSKVVTNVTDVTCVTYSTCMMPSLASWVIPAFVAAAILLSLSALIDSL